MIATPHCAINQAFSDRAHSIAQLMVYPSLFSVESHQLAFDDVTGIDIERNRVLDGEMAIDKIIRVTVNTLHAPLVFTVQERFRRSDKMRWRDITLTEWNNNSNRPSELYKIKAGLFVYGYYDEYKDRLVGETLVVNVPALLIRLASKRIKYETKLNPRSNQTFITIPFSSLDEYGLIEDRYIWK